MPDNSPPNTPPAPPNHPTAELSGRTGLLARIGDLIRAGTGVIGALPVLMVLRSGVLQPASVAGKPEETQTPGTLVEYLQALLKGVLVASEGHRLPELLRLLLSAVLLRLRISESGPKLDAVGNAHLIEPAVLAIVQAYNEEPRVRALLPDTTPEILKDVAELRFREEVLKELRSPATQVEGGVREVQHRLDQFIRQHVTNLGPLSGQIPRLCDVLSPAQSFVSGPAFKGQETQKATAKAREEGRAEGRAEAEARRQPPVSGGGATVVNLQTAPAVTLPADAPAAPAQPPAANRRAKR